MERSDRVLRQLAKKAPGPPSIPPPLTNSASLHFPRKAGHSATDRSAELELELRDALRDEERGRRLDQGQMGERLGEVA
jgi:hypothetical protein